MTENEKKEFDFSTVRTRTWNTVFKKGFESWLSLVFVGFLFAFIGASNASQVTFINMADTMLGLENELLPNNTAVVENVLHHFSRTGDFAGIDSQVTSTMIESLTRGQTWLVKLLGANIAYVERNPGEVIAYLLIAALIAFAVRYFIQNVLLIGQYRYVMENRFEKEVSPLRVLAPIHKEHLWNLVRVSFLYQFFLMLWSLTIIGGIWKHYQWYAVPYLLAENPDITWHEAKALSKKMTDGQKWNIFLCELQHIWLIIPEMIPVAGLLIAVPVGSQLGAEIYFHLREKITDDRAFFIEKSFDRPAYVDEPCGDVVFLLHDHVDVSPEVHRKKGFYTVWDYIFIFFVFCFIGWIWEVSLHLVQHQEFVNRGTMYGPWLPIYGIGGTGMIILLKGMRKQRLKMILCMLALCAVLEYGSSFILDYIYNASYWDYKEMFLNLNGRICLAGLAAFAIGGCFGIYVAGPKLRQFMRYVGQKKEIIICAVLISAFVIDAVCCAVFGFNAGSGVGESLAKLSGMIASFM